MDKGLANFIRDKQINSFPKLYLLLFLYKNPLLNSSIQQLVERLYIEAPLVEKITHDLQAVGILKQEHNYYILCNEPAFRNSLEKLARAFEHPLTRQELLEQVRSFSASAGSRSQIPQSISLAL
jgi:hypothetical protein